MNDLLKNREYIINWLEKYNIENYTLIKDSKYGYVVDVEGYVDLSDKKLSKIEIKFNYVKGYFNCSHNQLTSLKGAPQIINGGFYCHNNQLKSLVGTPQKVGRIFYCANNPQLGIYQKMTNFNEIKTLLEKDNLSNNLIIPEIHSIIHKL